MKTIKDIIEKFILIKANTTGNKIENNWIKSVVLDNIDKIVEEIGAEIND